MAISKLLIANRGEIAVRIIRAAKELGITTVQVHSAADVDSLAVEDGRRSSQYRPAACGEVLSQHPRSWMRRSRPALMQYIRAMVFSPRTPAFADAVEAAGLIFVGPTGDSIRVMGDKVAARGCGGSRGVPVVPGSDGRIDDPEEAIAISQRSAFR